MLLQPRGHITPLLRTLFVPRCRHLDVSLHVTIPQSASRVPCGTGVSHLSSFTMQPLVCVWWSPAKFERKVHFVPFCENCNLSDAAFGWLCTSSRGDKELNCNYKNFELLELQEIPQRLDFQVNNHQLLNLWQKLFQITGRHIHCFPVGGIRFWRFCISIS